MTVDDEVKAKSLDDTRRCGEKLRWHCIKHQRTEMCQKECFFREVLSLFGKKNTLQIIRILLINKKMRFNELNSIIGGSPKTLTTRLRELEDKGLICREVYNEIPMRVEYSLTEAGLDLDPLFEKITDWIRKWMINAE